MAHGANARTADERTPLLADGELPPKTLPVVDVVGRANDDPADDNDDDDDDEILEDADAAAIGEDDNDERAVVVTESPVRVALILGTVYVGVFVGAADGSVIATLSAPIASAFQSLSLLSWLAAAYLVANAACQPVSGRLTDVVGRGPGLVFSNVFFAAGNLMSALAPDATTMLVGRAVAGVGGGGLMAIATFLASDLVPLRRRGVIQGIGNIAYGAGSMLGGVLGGATQHVWEDRPYGGWRLAFFVQVPVAVVSAVLVAVLVHVPPHQSADDVVVESNNNNNNDNNKSASNSARAQLGRIDFPGAGFLVAFLVLVLLGLNAGGNIVPWTHPLVLTALPLSLVAFVAFVYWEAYRAHHPIIPVRLVLRRTVLAACMGNMLFTAAMMMAVFYIPLYLQVRGYSAADAGLRLLFSPLGLSISSVGTGLVMKRTGRYVGLGVGTAAAFGGAYVLALWALSAVDSPAWAPFGTFFLLGFGYGGILTVTLLACIAAVAQTRQAVITSATYAFRSVGGTLGLTVASAVYQNILRARLWARFGHLPDAAAEIGRICDDLDELRRLPPGWHDGVMQSFMDAFRGVWTTGLLLAVAGLVSLCLLKQHTLHATLSRP
ncbi:major facilitator superfamily transporter multidrug resistance [Niveomyces insectorum RCEF 264]|uniref:Major facilitator superfamily transporter multidrug resistance n=1 Tax=Niveomyces insectorum RCEF 264 TaxID=1081102 RepID=A0A162LCP3_9HYPO|nr:major facilitator superfamily transporter multidrug resistance [Niveomyces insectorum RCEF 264]